MAISGASSAAAGRLAGKVALVTGSGRGIGAAVARKFAEHGCRVVVADLNPETGGRIAAELGERAVFQPMDVRRAEDWTAAIAAARRHFGRLDILVNNAGTGYVSNIVDADPQKHRDLVELNLTSVWVGIRSVVGIMAEHGGGSIVNISSIDGLAGMADLSSYVATKFAVTGMTKALAIELADRGIRVNSVHPGITATELVAEATGASRARLDQAIAHQPIKRMGRPEEVANAVLFFASDESSYCTGAGLVVDGGHLAGPYREPLD